MKYDVIIVGAGMAGLTAAHQLMLSGANILVLEKESRVGGRVYSDNWQGYSWDAGTQFITSRYLDTLSLINKLNLNNKLRRIPPSIGIFLKEGLYSGSLLNPLFYLRFPQLTLTAKLKMFPILLEAFFTSNKCRCSPSYWAEKDEEELSDWVCRKIGCWANENFFGAITSSLYFTDTVNQSVSLFKHTMAELSTLKLYTLQGGLGILPYTLAQGINIVTNTSVEQIVVKGDEVNVLTSKHTYRCEKVLVAVPTPLDFFGQPQQLFEEKIVALLQKNSFSSSMVVAVPLKEIVTDKMFGLGVSPAVGINIGAVVFERFKDPSRVPINSDCLIMMTKKLPISCQQKEQMVAEIDKLYPSLTGVITYSKEYYWKHAVANFPLGRMKQLAHYQGCLARPPVFLCGDYWLGPSLECAVKSGYKAARSILKA